MQTRIIPYYLCTLAIAIAMTLLACHCALAMPNEKIHLRIGVDAYTPELADERRMLCDANGDSTKMQTLLKKLWVENGARYSGKKINNFGPDYPFVVIIFEMGDRKAILKSWHPFFRNRVDFVATASSLRPVNGKAEKQRVLSAQPADYLQFIRDFDAILDAAEKLGKPFRLSENAGASNKKR